MRKRGLRKAAAGLSVSALVMMSVSPASSATTSTWAGWTDLEGESRDYTASMTLAGQPELSADVTSDSRAGSVGLISGSSTWLSEGTPVGAKYGSSRNQPYLNLRPYADSASSPSTTTYAFDSPTPKSGWSFVLGDIDADQVSISATTAEGNPATSEDLGFKDGFNYCAEGVAGKPSCSGSAEDVPRWDETTLTLTGNDQAEDTSGAAAWFEPNVPLSSLTFEFTRRSGFPVYQTWFVSQARDITGSVIDEVDGPLGGVKVTLTDADGAVLATTTSEADGSFAFPEWFATDGYVVSFTVPDGKTVVGDDSQAIDLSEEDGVADFVVRDDSDEDLDAASDEDAGSDPDADTAADSDAASDEDAGTDPDAASDEDANSDPDAATATDPDADTTSDPDTTSDQEATSDDASDPSADSAVDVAAEADSVADSDDSSAGTGSEADSMGGDDVDSDSAADSTPDPTDAAGTDDGGKSADAAEGTGAHAGGTSGSDSSSSSADGARLPVTGSTGLQYSVGLGALLVATGLVLVVAVRRRRG
ncbi:MSCRAMM family adhesin SdrC [Brevibacterium sp. CCUG 69071]|uniref:MSCRAMM family adhesin SdrC n=1 Tax=Brevibacterium sp. CCUG 69071 TaxID=2052937 RepID=UPI001E5DE93F|nr:MSCRAMM family adhesin SdrC [Brevibacterium sp. CCUG 69071]